MNWPERIAFDPEVCHGQACIRGTRVLVSVVLDNLADGETPSTLAEAYGISAEDVHAALLYAAALAHERNIPLAHGAP